MMNCNNALIFRQMAEIDHPKLSATFLELSIGLKDLHLDVPKNKMIFFFFNCSLRIHAWEIIFGWVSKEACRAKAGQCLVTRQELFYTDDRPNEGAAATNKNKSGFRFIQCPLFPIPTATCIVTSTSLLLRRRWNIPGSQQNGEILSSFSL